MGRLQGKTAFITGIASGIGAATARRFLEEGAAVAGMDLNAPPEELAGRLVFCFGDVTREEDVSAAVETAAAELGRVDILVNAAGVASVGPVTELELAEWQRALNINVIGTVLPCKHVFRRMIEQGGGSVVNVASIEGVSGFSDTASYGASKGAVIQLTRNLAVDGAKHGIRVNCVSPGLVETPLTAVLNEDFLKDFKQAFVDQHLMKRSGRPEEIASAILFLASEEASFVTGHNLLADGGYTAGRTLEFDL